MTTDCQDVSYVIFCTALSFYNAEDYGWAEHVLTELEELLVNYETLTGNTHPVDLMIPAFKERLNLLTPDGTIDLSTGSP